MDIKDYFPENEQPLDRLVEDGGFCSIFRTFACVGDSLSSGEFQIPRNDGSEKKWSYYDMFEYSWGQFMARTLGSKVYNFSKGGMTARGKALLILFVGSQMAIGAFFAREHVLALILIAILFLCFLFSILFAVKTISKKEKGGAKKSNRREKKSLCKNKKP